MSTSTHHLDFLTADAMGQLPKIPATLTSSLQWAIPSTDDPNEHFRIYAPLGQLVCHLAMRKVTNMENCCLWPWQYSNGR